MPNSYPDISKLHNRNDRRIPNNAPTPPQPIAPIKPTMAEMVLQIKRRFYEFKMAAYGPPGAELVDYEVRVTSAIDLALTNAAILESQGLDEV